ncbi:unnamed protein product [Schistosoma haematobium]|nr:unnamed protein product [Schistosoma haematobium]
MTSKIIDMDNNGLSFYNSNPDINDYRNTGVGFLVNDQSMITTTDFEEVDGRIAIIKIHSKATKQTINLIGCYAPTESSNDHPLYLYPTLITNSTDKRSTTTFGREKDKKSSRKCCMYHTELLIIWQTPKVCRKNHNSPGSCVVIQRNPQRYMARLRLKWKVTKFLKVVHVSSEVVHHWANSKGLQKQLF